MRLALVFNPFKYKIHEENIRIVQKYFGLFPPLSLAWVAAIAEKAGHEVILIDARTLDLSKEEVLARMKEFNPDIMGFMMTTYMFPETLTWIKYLKKHLNIPVVVGGYNLRVYPRESVACPEIDFGVVEHAYYTIPMLFNELEGERKFENVPGLVYKKNNSIFVTDHLQKIDFNQFPFPARHLLPNELYAEFPTERKNFTVMVTSLGCVYKCNFCEASRTVYNERSPELIAEEMEECFNKYGIREIDIFDYEFTLIKNRVRQVCSLIRKKNLDINWACRSRIDTVDPALLEEMKLAGCRRIYFGLESGVQDILNRLDKGISLKQIKDIIGTCHDLRIKTLGFFLVGAPGETRESFRQTLKFAKTLNLDYVQFSKCLAKPLTPLWKKMVEDTKKDYWKDWILGKETDRELPRPWTSLTNKEINKLVKWGYLSYHARPLYILKHILKIHSWKEFKRKFYAFIDMLFKQEFIPGEYENFKAYNDNPRPKIIQLRNINLKDCSKI